MPLMGPTQEALSWWTTLPFITVVKCLPQLKMPVHLFTFFPHIHQISIQPKRCFLKLSITFKKMPQSSKYPVKSLMISFCKDFVQSQQMIAVVILIMQDMCRINLHDYNIADYMLQHSKVTFHSVFWYSLKHISFVLQIPPPIILHSRATPAKT